ncbi:MAG: GlcG/HbpS family heme-binding protein [Gemmatimonas sp.]
MTELTLTIAQKIVSAAIAYGREKNLMKLAVAVLDERGALKCFAAEEGTSLKRGEIAIGKANAALALGVGSRSINKMAKDRPYFIGSVTNAVGGSFVPVPGGVLVKNGAGAIVGAVGISGDVSDNDEAAALAGIAAAGLTADPGKD